jgi:hypothetical protein
MACEEHSEATDLTEVTELTKFIQEYGEDIPEDWELIDEENSSGEHQDFDFEKTLNEVANEKTMLASTGTAQYLARKSESRWNQKRLVIISELDMFMLKIIFYKIKQGIVENFAKK